MLSAKEAGEYCGLPAKLLPVAPIEMPNGRALFDIHDLDDFLDGLKNARPDTEDDVIGRLGR
jgi:hypothetical protein